jgi:hypothetical protein
MKLRTGGSMAWRGWALLGVAAMLAIAPVARGQEAPPPRPGAANSDVVRQFAEDYVAIRMYYSKLGRLRLDELENRAVAADVLRARYANIRKFDKPRFTLAEVIGHDPSVAADVLVAISPGLTIDQWSTDVVPATSDRTVRFLLRDPRSLETERTEQGEPGRSNQVGDVSPLDVIDFAAINDPRVAAFREVSREEMYRRVVARLPEVGQEKMFGVLVAMFQFDPWLAATTIDELAETGELPVKRPADAKPTRAQIISEAIQACRDVLFKGRVWSGVGTIGPMLPMGLELGGDRWWIRAALARELYLDVFAAAEAPIAGFGDVPGSPSASAMRQLIDDPHPIVRYVAFGQLERNKYESALKWYRASVKPAVVPEPNGAVAEGQSGAKERQAAAQRAKFESRLGKAITEIPEPPKE